MIRAALLALAFTLTTIAPALASPAPVPPDVQPFGGPLDERARAVVYLAMEQEGGGFGFCSGVHVTPNIILTAAHCALAGPPHLVTPHGGLVELSVVWTDTVVDLGLLQTPIAAAHTVELAPLVKAGMPIWVYSRGDSNPAPAIYPQFLSHVGYGDPREPLLMLLSESGMRGQSGSPVVDAEGRLVTILSSTNQWIAFGPASAGIFQAVLRAFAAQAELDR